MFVCVDVNASEHVFVCACVGQSNLCVHSWLLVSMYIYMCVFVTMCACIPVHTAYMCAGI